MASLIPGYVYDIFIFLLIPGAVYWWGFDLPNPPVRDNPGIGQIVKWNRIF